MLARLGPHRAPRSQQTEHGSGGCRSRRHHAAPTKWPVNKIVTDHTARLTNGVQHCILTLAHVVAP